MKRIIMSGCIFLMGFSAYACDSVYINARKSEHDLLVLNAAKRVIFKIKANEGSCEKVRTYLNACDVHSKCPFDVVIDNKTDPYAPPEIIGHYYINLKQIPEKLTWGITWMIVGKSESSKYKLIQNMESGMPVSHIAVVRANS